MYRRIALAGAIALAATGVIATGPARAQEYHLKAFYFGPKNTNFTRERWYPYLDMLEKASGGRIKFRRMHGFSILPPPKIYDGLAHGIVDLSYTPTSFTPGRFKRTELLSLPGIARDRYTGGKIANELLQSHLYKDFHDVVVPAFDFSGPRGVWTTKKPIHEISDLKGLRIRFDGEAEQLALTKIGAVPTAMPAPERFVALERGLLDGTIEVATSVEPFGIQELVKYRTNYNMGAAVTVLGWNKTTWNKFDSALQKKLYVVAQAGALDPIDKLGKKQDVELPREVWHKKYGLENIDPTEKQREEWKAVIKPLWNEMAEKLEAEGIEGKAIVADILKLQKKYGEPAYAPYIYP